MYRATTLVALVLLSGCGIQSAREAASGPAPADTRFKAAEAPAAPQAGDGANGDKQPPGLERKLIYTASVELVVEDFSGKPEQVQQLVQKYQGHVANSRVQGQAGGQRSAHWKLRIPIQHFEAFLNAVRSLGEVVGVNTDSREVTEEYYDVQARIKGKQLQRDRLQQLLSDKDRVAKLADLLEVERELARVQGEIEQFEGRLRLLENLTALTTVDLEIRQFKDYTPPEAAGFATRAYRTFGESFGSLTDTGQVIALIGIALVPWLPVLLLALVLARLVWRRLRPVRP